MTRAEAVELSDIRYLPLPADIYGLSAPRKAGGYIVIINRMLDAEEQAKTLEHELMHIRLGHHYGKEDLHMCEEDADDLTGY